MSLIQVTKPALQFPFNGSNVDSITNLSPIFSTGGANTFEAGKYNQAIRFNNTGITVSSNLAYNTQTFTFSQGITLTAWIKYNSFLATQNQAIDFYGTGGFFGIWVNNTTNKLIFFTGTAQLDTGISIVLGQWTHVAVWTNGTNMTMYVQGVATSATQATTGSNTCNKLAIASSDLGRDPAAVSVQDLRIYNTALTDIQVQSLYANGGAPGVPPSTTIKTQPFPPNYNYLADITDYSSNPINLATYAASSVVQNANSPFPAEYSFDITTVSGAPQPPSNTASKCAYYFLSVNKLNFDFFSATSNSFFECWLYVPIGSTLSSYPSIFGRYPALNNPSDFDWQIGVSPVSGSNIPIGMFFTNQSGNRIGPSGIGSINATVGQWNHVTMGWSSLNSRVYIGVNGNIVSGTANPSQYLATANTVIGRQQWDSGCLLSNFRLVSLGVNILPYTTSTYTIPTSPLDIYPTGTTALLIRSHQIMTMTGTPLLSQLSVAPVATFSLRAVGGTTARAVQVNRYLITDTSTNPYLPTFTNATSNSLGPFTTLGSIYYNIGTSSWPITSKMQFDLFSSGNTFLECWIYFTAAPTSNFPALFYRNGQISFYFNNNASMFVAIVNASGGSAMGVLTVGTVPLNTWTHVSVSINQITSTLYASISGTVVSRTYTLGGSNYISTNPFYLISFNYPSSIYVTDFRCVSGATSLPYSSNFTPPAAPLTTYSSGTTVMLLTVPATTSDFYADRLGNLLTAPVTGQSLSDWLGGSTGSVATWYDQSGNGNHATQGTPANRPVINVATSPYSLFFSGNGSISGQSLQTSSLSFTPGAAGGKIGVEYIVGNNTGGCVLGAGSSARKWWLASTSAASTTNELTQGNFPATVGGGEGYSMCSTAITSAKTTVVYNSTASGSGQLYYINRTSQTTTSKSWNTNIDGTFPLVIGAMTVGNFTYYSGNLYELIVTIPNFSTSDISLF